jgi:hypothetical protein
MIFKLITRLDKSGDLKKLADAGLLSTKLFMYKEVYMDYDKNIRTGLSKMEALYKTSIDMKVGESLVYRAKNLMER